MQHDDCKDYAEANPVRKLNNLEDVITTCNEVSSRSSQSENAKRFIINDTSVSNNFRKASSSFGNRFCHADSSMAHSASSNSYYNSQTGTSIVHISSNSLVSSTLRENSNYIERQWAILKEKMLPATKSKPSSSDNDKGVTVPEHVEERYEVDFSFIDDPNGNELDNSYSKYSDSCKSNNMTSHVTSIGLHGNGTINDNSSSCEPKFSDNHMPDGSVPSCISMQALTEDKSPNKSGSDVTSSSDLKRFIKLNDMSKHSYNEKSKNDRNMVHSVICDINRSLVTSKPSLLVPSYKDEFLYNANPLYLKRNKEPTHERACSTYRDAQTQKCPDVNKMNTVSSHEGTLGSAMNVDYSCPSEVAKDADHEVQKSSEESKSKKYQEMLNRKQKKTQKKLEESISSNEVPDYKGNIPLDEIINFINKDVKVSSHTKSGKSSKKHKKRISKKDSLEGDLPKNPTQQREIELLNDFQRVIESSCGKKSIELSDLCNQSQEVKPSKNCSEECDLALQSTVSEDEPKPVSTSRDSFGDCDQFSVVRKKKKLKKTVCSNGLGKSVSKNSCMPGLASSGDKSPFVLCSKSKKNEANMYVKGNIHVAEQNIPKSKSRPSIKNHVEEKDSLPSQTKLINVEPKKISQNMAELPEQVTPKLSELSNCWHIQRNVKSSAVVIAETFLRNCESQDIVPCLSAPDRSEFPATGCSSKPFIADTNFKADEEPTKPRVCVMPLAKKSESLSKPKSAFNLKHAQAFMNSTYQEVIKSKGYILYNHSN